MARKRYGKAFRTKSGKFGRYVYVRGKRVAFETLRAAKRGAYRYVSWKVYNRLKQRDYKMQRKKYY